MIMYMRVNAPSWDYSPALMWPKIRVKVRNKVSGEDEV